MTIACVLTTRNTGRRNGGTCYGPEWVYALKRGLARHGYSGDFRVLTDVESVPPVWSRRLLHGWPGWWSKIELFRPGLFDGPVLYLDLDTLPVGPVDDLASYGGSFAILRDFYRARHWQSAVMAWTPGEHTQAIYERFTDDPHSYMRRFRSDQEFIEDTLRTHGADVDIVQDLLPGQVVSLKVHAKAGPPDGARLVCGHGKPRLSDPGAGWAHDEWAAMARSVA